MTYSRFLRLAPFTTLLLVLAVAALGGTPSDQKIAQLRVGLTETDAVNLLGTPDQRSAEGKRSVMSYGDLTLQIQKSKIQEIEWRLNPPRDRNILIPADLRLIELPRERMSDVVLPARRLAHPASGRIWLISGEGKVEALIIKAPWKNTKRGEAMEKLLQKQPPGEDSVVRRK